MPRITWPDLPDAMQAEVEGIVGGPVVEHRSHPGGFSPGTADTVTTNDGRTAFVKAVHGDLNPDSPALHRRELAVMRALPTGLPVPRLLGGFERDGWVVLVIEHVDADHPALPWTHATLAPVVDAVLDLSDGLTPSPIERPPASGELAEMWTGFERCLAAPPADLDPWVARRLAALDARARAGIATLDGDTLVHLDLRADNILLRRGDGPLRDRVVIIDWPWAVAGARWLDATLLTSEAPVAGDSESVAATDAALERIAARFGVPTDPLVDQLVGITAFLTWRSREPGPPGLPTLRAFQRERADALTGWLKETRLRTW